MLMKRVTSIVIILMLVFSISTVAFADNVSFNNYNPNSDMNTIYIFNASLVNNWVGENCQIKSGPYVKIVQCAVNSLGYSCGVVDGQYGPTTKAGIQAFQTAYGLSPDGDVGEETWTQLYNVRGWYGSYGYVLHFT